MPCRLVLSYDMINIQATLYLLAFPIGLMGLVQAFFALLSLWVFDDHHQTQFLTPALLMLFTTASRSLPSAS